MKNIIILTFMANCVFTSVHKKENQEAIYSISRDPLKNSTHTYTIYIYRQVIPVHMFDNFNN